MIEKALPGAMIVLTKCCIDTSNFSLDPKTLIGTTIYLPHPRPRIEPVLSLVRDQIVEDFK